MRSEGEQKGRKKNEIKSGAEMGFKSHPQSTYRGRGETVGVYLPSQLEPTSQLCT